MGRRCILDSPPPPRGRVMPLAVRIRCPACHGRRFKGERPIGAATGQQRANHQGLVPNPPPPPPVRQAGACGFGGRQSRTTRGSSMRALGSVRRCIGLRGSGRAHGASLYAPAKMRCAAPVEMVRSRPFLEERGVHPPPSGPLGPGPWFCLEKQHLHKSVALPFLVPSSRPPAPTPTQGDGHEHPPPPPCVQTTPVVGPTGEGHHGIGRFQFPVAHGGHVFAVSCGWVFREGLVIGAGGAVIAAVIVVFLGSPKPVQWPSPFPTQILSPTVPHPGGPITGSLCVLRAYPRNRFRCLKDVVRLCLVTARAQRPCPNETCRCFRDCWAF